MEVCHQRLPLQGGKEMTKIKRLTNNVSWFMKVLRL